MIARTPPHRFRPLRSLVRLGAVALLGTASEGAAAPVTVVNPGFEDITGETPVNEFTFGALNGWDLYDPDTITDDGDGPTYFLGTLTPVEPDPGGNPGVYAFFPAGAPEGQRVGIAFSFFGSGGQGEWGFAQVLDATLQPKTRYTLRVRIGNIASGTSVGGGFFPLDGFPGYRVVLLAGGEMLAQDLDSLAGSIPEGEFAESTVEFVTGVHHDRFDENLEIRLINLNAVDPVFPNSDLEVDFDDVRLDATPVPEAVPAMSALHALVLAAGIAAFGAFRIGVSRWRGVRNPRDDA